MSLSRPSRWCHHCPPPFAFCRAGNGSSCSQEAVREEGRPTVTTSVLKWLVDLQGKHFAQQGDRGRKRIVLSSSRSLQVPCYHAPHVILILTSEVNVLHTDAQIWKLRMRDAEWLAYGHMTGRCRSRMAKHATSHLWLWWEQPALWGRRRPACKTDMIGLWGWFPSE